MNLISRIVRSIKRFLANRAYHNALYKLEYHTVSHGPYPAGKDMTTRWEMTRRVADLRRELQS